MKLEVGKCYRTRDGRKAGPLGPYDKVIYPPYCFIGDVFDGERKDPNRLWNTDGTHRHNGRHLDLVEEWEDEMKITMDGKYAYRKDPFTQVRILCVDRPGHVNDPVCSMDPLTGFIRCHDKNGSQETVSFDLVPLQEKLPDLWVVVYEDGGTFSFKDKSAAEAWVETSMFKPKLYKYTPAPDQTS